MLDHAGVDLSLIYGTDFEKNGLAFMYNNNKDDLI